MHSCISHGRDISCTYCKLRVICRTKELLLKGKGLFINTTSIFVYIIVMFMQVHASKNLSDFSAMNSVLYVH